MLGPDFAGYELPHLTEEERQRLLLQIRRGKLPLLETGEVDWANAKLPSWRQSGPEVCTQTNGWKIC